MKRAGFLSVILASTVAVLATFSSARYAAEPPACDSNVARCFAIKDRDGKKLVDHQVHLQDLISNEAFEGKIFKIVHADSDDAIRFDADPQLALRAATVYYHMNKARNWFLAQKEFQVEPFKTSLNEKLTVRIDIDLPFNKTIHFERSGKFVHNGARSVGPSRDFEKDDDTPAWGYETFFYKAGAVKSASQAEYFGDMITTSDFKGSLRNNLLYGDFIDLANDAMDDGRIIPIIHVYNVLLSIGLSEAIPTLLGGLMKLFKGRELLDSPLIPEISYHEYCHTVLAPIFGELVSSALNEGFPNYFAYKISGLPELADHVGRSVSRGFAPKDGKDKDRYSFDKDYSLNAARQSFAFSVLVDLDQALGADALPILVGAFKKDPASKKPYLDANSRMKKSYSGFGSSLDEALTQSVLDYANGDAGKVEVLTTRFRGVLKKRSL